MKLHLTIALLSFYALSAFGQTTTPVTPDSSIAAILTDPANLSTISSMAALAANVTTDWHLDVAQKQYTFTPAQTAGMIGGGTLLFLAIDHYAKPGGGMRRVTTGVKIGLTAYLTGRAIANTYSHGPASTATPPASTPKLAFAVTIRR